MNRTVRKLLAKVEARGGIVGLNPEIPDWIAERFLREVLDCPMCLDAARRKAAPAGLDAALAKEPRGEG